MAAIHAHGLVWKDTFPGVWTAMIELFGRTMTAYAIEMQQEAGGRSWEPVDDEYGYIYWRHQQQASGFAEPELIDLGTLKCVVYVV